ncbi:MAG: helix-turn-helix domain-containing protein [Aquabacterium sp.]|uniref:helix-turn-helix domain-containing protein n=1 Tax=Aquabacterium sp. TaxID=1872578 RepID=UPI0035C6B0C1
MPSARPVDAPSAPAAPLWGALASAHAGLHEVRAHDVDEHAHNLTAWQQHYDQLGPGRFVGRLTEWRLPHIQVFREQTSQALRQSCEVWTDSFWFGVPDPLATLPTRINGRLHGTHDVMVRPGGERFELVTPDRHSLFGVVVQRQALMDAAAQQGCRLDWHALQQAEVLRARDDARQACLHALDGLLPLSEPQPAARRDADLQAMEGAVLSLLLDLLDTSEVDTAMRHSLARRQKVVTQAHAYVLAHPDQAVTVPELCERLHVSRRTLQYCFEEVMGLSPIQYLRAIRLNGARRHLREAALQGQGVQDVAARWGFWHLSQFALDYRKLFGESPSETLNRGAH